MEHILQKGGFRKALQDWKSLSLHPSFQHRGKSSTCWGKGEARTRGLEAGQQELSSEGLAGELCLICSSGQLLHC